MEYACVSLSVILGRVNGIGGRASTARARPVICAALIRLLGRALAFWPPTNVEV